MFCHVFCLKGKSIFQGSIQRNFNLRSLSLVVGQKGKEGCWENKMHFQ